MFKLTIGIEKSTDLKDFTLSPFTAPPTVNGQGKLEYLFAPSDNAAFFRLNANC